MGEMKFLDTDYVIGALTGTNQLNTINTVVQGTGETERIGRRITVHRIEMKYNLTLLEQADGAQANDIVRMIVYLDRQTNGTSAVITDILESNNFQSFRNLANVGRFKIIVDKTVQMNTYAGAGNGTTDQFSSMTRFKKWSIKVKIPIEYNSTTGTLPEVRSNNIGIFMLTKSGNSALNGKIRIRFTG